MILHRRVRSRRANVAMVNCTSGMVVDVEALLRRVPLTLAIPDDWIDRRLNDGGMYGDSPL